MAELLILGLSLIGIGFLYLRVVQPILVDFKLIPPRGGTPAVVEITSSNIEKPDTDAVVPVSSTSIDTGIAPANTSKISRNLTEREIVILLAAQKNGAEYRYSGNAIYGLVKGNRNGIMALVAELRGGTLDDAAPDDMILTPIAGRPTRASYYDDPQLEYQAPTPA